MTEREAPKTEDPTDGPREKLSIAKADLVEAITRESLSLETRVAARQAHKEACATHNTDKDRLIDAEALVGRLTKALVEAEQA